MEKPSPATTMIQKIDADLMTERDLAECLGVQVNRIRNMSRKGSLPEPARMGHFRVYRKSELAARLHSPASKPTAAGSK